MDGEAPGEAIALIPPTRTQFQLQLSEVSRVPSMSPSPQVKREQKLHLKVFLATTHMEGKQ